MRHLDKCMICPKCQTKTMRKSISKGHGEYFDDKCHEYFTIEELVNQWNYDLGDFGGTDATTFYKIAKLKKYSMYYPILILEQNSVPQEYEIIPIGFFPNEGLFPDTVSPIDEPQFSSKKERDEVYEMVDRMFMAIPEWWMVQEEGTGNDDIDTFSLRHGLF